ncbi:hypothetical protein [Streptomyces sp. NPDC056323]|uniref:hypothetical protein n=1 Tax=Streptomyces sp. NPDC056323 TaxID=3345784 RepID=UPI0035D6D419
MSLRERRRIELLEWVEEQLRDSGSGAVDAKTWAARNGVADLELRTLVDGLKADGLLKDAGVEYDWWTAWASIGGAVGTGARGRRVSLAPAGVAELQGIRARRSNRLKRNVHVRNVILQWLYEREVEPVRSLTEMINDPEVHFHWEGLTRDEVRRAFVYLSEESMVRGRIAVGGDVLVPRLTARGIECVESGANVTDFVSRQKSGGNIYHTYLPNAQGVIVGEQQNFTQNNNAGVDPSEFVRLAGYLGQVSATLGLEDSERVELEQAAQDLHAAATSESPEPSSLRTLTTRVLDGLANAAGTVAGQMALQMGQSALGSLG